MPGSEYGTIPYEVDEITSWMNDNFPGMIEDAVTDKMKLQVLRIPMRVYGDGLFSTTSTSFVDITDCYAIVDWNALAKAELDLGYFMAYLKHSDSGDQLQCELYNMDEGESIKQIVKTSTSWAAISGSFTWTYTTPDEVKARLRCIDPGTAYVRNVELWFLHNTA